MWDNMQDFVNFEESICHGISTDTKIGPYYSKAVFMLMFRQLFFSLICWTTANVKVFKNC